MFDYTNFLRTMSKFPRFHYYVAYNPNELRQYAKGKLIAEFVPEKKAPFAGFHLYAENSLGDDEISKFLDSMEKCLSKDRITLEKR